MRRRCMFTADRIGSARAGIGIRGSARTPSFRATEFSIARLDGDSTRRFMLDGRRLVLATDSAMAGITGTITTTLATTIMPGGQDRITILEFVAVDLARAMARSAFAVAKDFTAGALAVDSMAAVVDSMVVVEASMVAADLVAGTGGKL